MLRRSPLKRGAPLARTGGVKRVSAKRAAENRIRRKMVAGIVGGPCETCPVIQTWDPRHPCDGVAVEVHEPLTRARGGSIVDPDNAMGTCRRGHDWIHGHPSKSAELGLLLHSWEG